MRFAKAFSFGVVLMVAAASANAATYYVSTTGSDSNAGTLSAPFLTLSKAAGVAKAGDTVNLRGGVYGKTTITSVGTSSARITIQSYPGETAVFDGTGTAAGTDLLTAYKAAYVDLVGLEVRNSKKIGISLWGAHDITVRSSNIHHNFKNGIYAGFDTMGVVSNIVVDGCDVHDNALNNEFNQLTSGGWGNGMAIGSDGGRITGNRVYNNHGEGIIAGLASNLVVQDNVVYDNFAVNMYLDNASNVKVDRNFIYNTGDSRFYRFSLPSSGIQLANETYAISNPLNNVTVTNNIVVNSRWGLGYGNYENGGGLKNVTIANNTFYRAGELLHIDADAHVGTIIENNVFYQVGNTMTSVASTSGIVYRSNNWYGGNAGVAAGTGDVLADPRLANPGANTPEAYRLTSASPLLRMGVSVSVVNTDFFGATRANAYDIGAHQLSSGSGATADTIAPSVPVGVTATATSSSSVKVAWAASTDNVAVTGYKVYRNGAYVTSVTGLTFDDSGLTGATSYSYAVASYDGAGNQSATSTAVTMSTLPSGSLPSSGSSDPQAPTAPASLSAVATGTSSIALTWSAATDNVGVTGYDVYRNGTKVATLAATSWTDQGLSGSTAYAYSVVAFDAMGNRSASSNTATAVTQAAAPAQDTQAPSTPWGLRVAAVGTTTATIAWDAASDNVGVTGYTVRRDGVVVASNVSGTSWSDAGLKSGAKYSYSVQAFDAASNRSSESAALSVTTAKTKSRAASH